MNYIFDSKVEFGNTIYNSNNESFVKNEPMFWRASPQYALEHGGHLTRKFLVELGKQKEWATDPNVLIDSRVHMLFPEWWPSIPGFHFDDVPRELPNKQPNHKNPSYQAQHCMALCGDASLTEFAVGVASFPEVGEDEKYYKVWHPMVVDYINKGVLKSVIAEPNRLIFFDCWSWHQGTKATKRGHRFFIRATRNTNLKCMNEIRRNANVYLESPMEGW